jgi:PTS system N-acetylgalactosamine-specific IIA component
MVSILITGHGNFPSGALSAVNLVAGNPGNVAAVDFVEGMSAEELKER